MGGSGGPALAIGSNWQWACVGVKGEDEGFWVFVFYLKHFLFFFSFDLAEERGFNAEKFTTITIRGL